MTTIKNKLQCLVPLLLGLYSLTQGGVLVMSNDPLTQLLGVGVFLWLPGCMYYTWRGRTALLPRLATARPAPRYAPSSLVGRQTGIAALNME